MSSAPSKMRTQDINKIIYLSRIFNSNLANANILCFYKTKSKQGFNTFKANIQRGNFCHLVGIEPNKRFIDRAYECKMNRSPSNLIFDSIISGDKNFVRNVDYTHNFKFVKDKLKVANSLFSFNKQENINIEINNNDIDIRVKSDHFIHKYNYVLGFAFDSNKGLYYPETSLLLENKKTFQNSFPVLCFIKNHNYMQYKFTMCSKTLSREDKINLLNEFIRSEKINPNETTEVKFLDNEIYKTNFKDLWEEIVERNINLVTSHDRNISMDCVSLEEEISYAKSVSKQLNNNKVICGKDIGSFEPDI